MKNSISALLFVGLLATASIPATDVSPAPYQFLLHFPDKSIVVCGVTDFGINDPFPQTQVEVTDCAPDVIFKNGFE